MLNTPDDDDDDDDERGRCVWQVAACGRGEPADGGRGDGGGGTPGRRGQAAPGTATAAHVAAVERTGARPDRRRTPAAARRPPAAPPHRRSYMFLKTSQFFCPVAVPRWSRGGTAPDRG